MIKKTLVSFLIALVAFGFTACDSDDNNVQLGVPDSSKPSTEFKVGNCDKEKYADDAIKLNVQSWGNTNQEFASIELFADGRQAAQEQDERNARSRRFDNVQEVGRSAAKDTRR